MGQEVKSGGARAPATPTSSAPIIIGNSLHQFMHIFAQLVYTKSKPNFFDDLMETSLVNGLPNVWPYSLLLTL